MRENAGLAAIGSFLVLAIVAGSQWWKAKIHLRKAEEKAHLAQEHADLTASERNALESRLKKAEEKARLAQTSANLTANQPNPEQTEPANARPNAKLASATQSFDSPAQTTARYGLPPVGKLLWQRRSLAPKDSGVHGALPPRMAYAKVGTRGEPKILHLADPQQYEVLAPFTWRVSDGLRHAQGSATLYMRIQKNAKGEFSHCSPRNRY
jgi:hypothetical protein